MVAEIYKVQNVTSVLGHNRSKSSQESGQGKWSRKSPLPLLIFESLTVETHRSSLVPSSREGAVGTITS